MGLLRNDQNIIIDMVLTDTGRKKLAQGSFKPVKFALGDDGIDYSLFTQTTGSASQDSEILKTVIMEAPVDERVGLVYPCISVANDKLNFLPTLDASSDPLTVNERDNSVSGKVVEFQQNTHNAKRSVPEEILDGTFTLKMNSDLLGIQKETPRSVNSDNLAYYTLKRTDTNSVNGAKISVPVMVKSIEDDMWDELGEGTKPNRWIDTIIWIQGNQSGLTQRIDVKINEALSR